MRGKLIVILFILFNTANYQLVFTFGDLGFDIYISGKGNVYRESEYISGLENMEALITWTIYFKLDGEPNYSIIFNVGLNDHSLNIKLIKNPAFGEIKVIIKKTNIIWVNVTVNNADLIIYPNSTVKIEKISNTNYGSLCYTILFYLTFLLPIVVLIIKRLKLRGEMEKIIYEEA